MVAHEGGVAVPVDVHGPLKAREVGVSSAHVLGLTGREGADNPTAAVAAPAGAAAGS